MTTDLVVLCSKLMAKLGDLAYAAELLSASIRDDRYESSLLLRAAADDLLDDSRPTTMSRVKAALICRRASMAIFPLWPGRLRFDQLARHVAKAHFDID